MGWWVNNETINFYDYLVYQHTTGKWYMVKLSRKDNKKKSVLHFGRYVLEECLSGVKFEHKGIEGRVEAISVSKLAEEIKNQNAVDRAYKNYENALTEPFTCGDVSSTRKETIDRLERIYTDCCMKRMGNFLDSINGYFRYFLMLSEETQKKRFSRWQEFLKACTAFEDAFNNHIYDTDVWHFGLLEGGLTLDGTWKNWLTTQNPSILRSKLQQMQRTHGSPA